MWFWFLLLIAVFLSLGCFCFSWRNIEHRAVGAPGEILEFHQIRGARNGLALVPLANRVSGLTDLVADLLKAREVKFFPELVNDRGV